MVRQQSLPYSPAAPAAPSPRRERRAPAGVGLAVSFVLALAFWKAIVVLRDYPAFILPTPEAVFSRLLLELSSGTLRHHALLTLTESLGGFAMAL
ncbi:hypothetical protein SE17_37770, partial [Kouleothrix aurantiaca]